MRWVGWRNQDHVRVFGPVLSQSSWWEAVKREKIVLRKACLTRACLCGSCLCVAGEECAGSGWLVRLRGSFARIVVVFLVQKQKDFWSSTEGKPSGAGSGKVLELMGHPKSFLTTHDTYYLQHLSHSLPILCPTLLFLHSKPVTAIRQPYHQFSDWRKVYWNWE